MRNLLKLIFQRVVVVSLALLLQIAFFVIGLHYLKEYYRWISIALRILTWVLVVFIITGRGNPSYKIAWIVPILAFPVFGIVIYLLFGGNRVSRREHTRMQPIYAATHRQLLQDEGVMLELKSRGGSAYSHARYIAAASGFPVFPCGQTVYFPSGEACFARMLAELERAENYIFLEFFIIEHGQMWDSILEILRRKAENGVDVRVLYDDFGCIKRLPMRYAQKLESFGIRAHAFNPYLPILSGRLNNRDHRKLMIIDGETAFTGGINLADEYINRTSPLGHWKDCGILVQGEAAWSMTVMFLSLWDYVDHTQEDYDLLRPEERDPDEGRGFVQPFADSPVGGENVGASLLESLVYGAQERLWIMTPYLILDDKMTDALCMAARRGVDVRIVTPGTPDKWYVHAVTRANYESLTAGGVRIFEYSPGFVHAKVFLADSGCAVVGTVNLDFRSLYLHFEDAVVLYASDAIPAVEADFEQTFPRCREITYEACRHVYIHQRMIRALLRLFSPLM